MGTSVISSELGWLLHMTMTNEWKGDTSWFYHEIKSVCEKSLLKLPPGDRGGASRADQCRWPEGCSLSGSWILNIDAFFQVKLRQSREENRWWQKLWKWDLFLCTKCISLWFDFHLRVHSRALMVGGDLAMSKMQGSTILPSLFDAQQFRIP